MSAPENRVPENRHSEEVGEAPSAETIAAALTPAQRRALHQRQDQLFAGKSTVTGHGMTMRALRSRGIVRGAMPHAYLTDFGRAVIARCEVSE